MDQNHIDFSGAKKPKRRQLKFRENSTAEKTESHTDDGEDVRRMSMQPSSNTSSMTGSAIIMDAVFEEVASPMQPAVVETLTAEKCEVTATLNTSDESPIEQQMTTTTPIESSVVHEVPQQGAAVQLDGSSNVNQPMMNSDDASPTPPIAPTIVVDAPVEPLSSAPSSMAHAPITMADLPALLEKSMAGGEDSMSAYDSSSEDEPALSAAEMAEQGETLSPLQAASSDQWVEDPDAPLRRRASSSNIRRHRDASTMAMGGDVFEDFMPTEQDLLTLPADTLNSETDPGHSITELMEDMAATSTSEPLHRPVFEQPISALNDARYLTLPLRTQQFLSADGIMAITPRSTVLASPLPDVEKPSLANMTSDKRKALLAAEYASSPKRGWLMKRGGQLGNKGWDSRWFVYEKNTLSYYVKEKDTKPRCSIPLQNMLEIRATHDDKEKTPNRTPFKFEIITAARTFYLCASSSQDMTEWMILLGVLIDSHQSSLKTVTGTPGVSATTTQSGAFEEKNGFVKAKDPELDADRGFTDHYLAVKPGVIAVYAVCDVAGIGKFAQRTFLLLQNYDDYLQSNARISFDTSVVVVRIGIALSDDGLSPIELVAYSQVMELQV